MDEKAWTLTAHAFQSDIMINISQMSEWLRPVAEQIINTPLFQQYGIIFLFFYAQTPSFVILPNEFFTLPLFLGGASPYILVLILGLGGFFGDLWLFLIGKYSSNYFRKLGGRKKTSVAKVDHIMHEHRYVVFLAPAIPYVPTVVGDLVMLLAGHQNLDFKKIAPIILLAEFIKATIITLTVMGIVSLFPIF